MSADPTSTARAGEEAESTLPPVTQIAMASLALVIAGGIYLAAHAPHPTALTPAIVLATVAGALLIVNAISIARIRSFAWTTFVLVGRWTLLVYVVIAGMLEYVFVRDHTPGSELALFSVMLVIFALNIPTLLAFSVARYQPPTSGD
jgi:hypothetical protein